MHQRHPLHSTTLSLSPPNHNPNHNNNKKTKNPTKSYPAVTCFFFSTHIWKEETSCLLKIEACRSREECCNTGSYERSLRRGAWRLVLLPPIFKETLYLTFTRAVLSADTLRHSFHGARLLTGTGRSVAFWNFGILFFRVCLFFVVICRFWICGFVFRFILWENFLFRFFFTRK